MHFYAIFHFYFLPPNLHCFLPPHNNIYPCKMMLLISLLYLIVLTFQKHEHVIFLRLELEVELGKSKKKPN